MHNLGPDEVPCFRCKMPDLLEENVVPWMVFSIASSQMRYVGMNAMPTGLDFSAIDRGMDIMGVHPFDRDMVFERVRVCGIKLAEMVRDREDAKQRQQLAKNNKGRIETKGGPDLPPMISGKPMPV